VIKTFVKSDLKKKGTRAKAVTEKFALLTERSQYTGEAHYLGYCAKVVEMRLLWNKIRIDLILGKECGKIERTEHIKKREKEES